MIEEEKKFWFHFIFLNLLMSICLFITYLVIKDDSHSSYIVYPLFILFLGDFLTIIGIFLAKKDEQKG